MNSNNPRGEVWGIIRRAMDTPTTSDFETESAYRDTYASEAADKVIALLEATRAEPDSDAIEKAGYKADQKLFERVGAHVRQAMEFAILGEMDLSDVEIYSEKYRDRIVDDIDEDIVAPIEAEARLHASVEPEPDADAVERAASAIHRVDVSMFPDSVRHIPARTVYRDRASAALQAAAVEPEENDDAT